MVDYIYELNNIKLIILKGLNLNSKEDFIKYRTSNPEGEFFLNGKNTYAFHGRGCTFTNSDITIDWDFGYNVEWCGINPRAFSKYIVDYNNDISELYDINKIIYVFEKWIIQGVMCKKYELYYLN